MTIIKNSLKRSNPSRVGNTICSRTPITAEARCVAYVIAKKYGVPTDLVQIHSIPARFADYDKKQIKEEFGDIHACVRAISGRMDDALGLRKEKQKDAPSREDSR